MKKTVSIILCALILISATFVFANSEETVTAVRTVFNMLVRGEETAVPDMVVIDGRTYVPLRAMGELLDVNVDWDEETGQETAFEISYEKPVEEFGYFGEDGELVPCPYEDTVFYYKEK